MDLVLTEEESSALLQALRSYLSDLRVEIADTDNPAFRRGLRHEREVLEKVVSSLEAANSPAAERDEQGRAIVRFVTFWTTSG